MPLKLLTLGRGDHPLQATSGHPKPLVQSCMLQSSQNEHGCEFAAGSGCLPWLSLSRPKCQVQKFPTKSSKGKDRAGPGPCPREIGFSKYILRHRPFSQKDPIPTRKWPEAKKRNSWNSNVRLQPCVVWGSHSAPNTGSRPEDVRNHILQPGWQRWCLSKAASTHIPRLPWEAPLQGKIAQVSSTLTTRGVL